MELRHQLDWLKRTLLDTVTTPFPDALKPDEKAAVAAYLVLAHACIEEAIEDAFYERAEILTEILKRHPRPPRMAAFLGYNAALKLPEKKRVTYKKRKLGGSLLAALETYQSTVVSQNHGIKESNLLALAEGAGVEWENLESELAVAIADFGTLGAKRGSVGHLSPFTDKSALITSQIDKEDVVKWVKEAEKGVEGLLAYLNKDLVDTGLSYRVTVQRS